MKGLELARKAYDEVGRPILQAEFPQLFCRMAVGLAGDGSECMGFDDEISQDHDFGAGFCIWLTKEDYRRMGERVQQVYLALPFAAAGLKARMVSPHGNDRIGAIEITEFYARFIGREQPPRSLMRWLTLPEDKLAAVTSGQVFEDGLGEFSRIRQSLKRYYPEDVRIKKIAARAVAMAQSGQYNYARCMRRGEYVAAGLAVDEFVKHTISMIYLLNRKYMPYYKWMFRGIQSAEYAGKAVPLIAELMETGTQRHAWGRDAESEAYALNWKDKKVCIMEEICRQIRMELARQELIRDCTSSDFLEPYGGEIMSRIKSEELRRCHVLLG